MTIKFDIDMEDMMSFQKRYIQTNSAMQKMKRMLTYIFPLFMLVFFFIAFYNKYNRLDMAFIIFIFIVCALWVIFIPRFFEKTSLKKAKKLLMKPENSIMFGQFEMSFTNDAIDVKTPNTATSLQWDAVQSVDETDEYVYLYLSAVSAYIIPKRKISRSEVESLRSLLKEHLL